MATSDYTSEIPYGYCQCGCGQKTNIAKYDNKRFGHIKGEPFNYISTHSSRHHFYKNANDIFWSRVNKDGSIPAHMPHLGKCWEWTASCAKSGYGDMRYKGKVRTTHRISWVMHNGEIPDGLWVLHHCDNKKCVNPDHLFLGNRQDNVEDMVKKDRTQRGILSHKETDVICKRYAVGDISLESLGHEYGVSRETISKITKGKYRANDL